MNYAVLWLCDGYKTFMHEKFSECYYSVWYSTSLNPFSKVKSFPFDYFKLGIPGINSYSELYKRRFKLPRLGILWWKSGGNKDSLFLWTSNMYISGVKNCRIMKKKKKEGVAWRERGVIWNNLMIYWQSDDEASSHWKRQSLKLTWTRISALNFIFLPVVVIVMIQTTLSMSLCNDDIVPRQF